METDALNTDEVCMTYPQCVAEAIQMSQRIILLDSRSFVEYNTSHILKAINVGGNRAFRRKFSQNRVPMDKLLLKLTGSTELSSLQSVPIIVYDNCLDDMSHLNPDCFLYGLLCQLLRSFYPVFLLKGGFLGFQAHFPQLCWANENRLAGEDLVQYDQADCELERVLDSCLLEALGSGSSTVRIECCGSVSGRLWCSQVSRSGGGLPSSCADPGLPPAGWIDSSASGHDSNPRPLCYPDVPLKPSLVLPHLVVGSQADALSQSVTQQYGITHVLNVSVDGPAPSHIQPERFMRIPVQDSYNAVILPYFNDAFKFIDEAKTSKGCVLVHCAAGISRSPTVAIAYLMHTNHMSMRDAYNLVKSKRASIAPNFNFLGQLLDFDRQLFPSSSPGQSSSGGSTPVQQQQLRPPDASNRAAGPLTSTKRPSIQLTPIACTSPKHAVTKKRERPTYLSLDPYTSASTFVHPAAGQLSYQPSPTGGAQSVIPGMDSPNEGKRSRVSLFTLLPSPCTGLSGLKLSSPSEDRRRVSLLLSAQTGSSSGKLLAPALTNLSWTSMDKLHYEPCAVGGDSQAYASTSGGRLRRSLTSVAMSNTAAAAASTNAIRPTLLAERRVSHQQQSAPSTPNRFPIEWGRQPVGQLDLPSPGSNATSGSSRTSTSVPFTRDFSPIAERCGTEPPIEFDELQQCGRPSESHTQLAGSQSLSRLSRSRPHPEPRSSISHDYPPVSCVTSCHRLSHSAPSCSTGAVQRTAAPEPEHQVRARPILSSSSPVARMWWTHALGLELSCRQEQTLWHSANRNHAVSVRSSSSRSPTAGSLTTHTGSHLTLFPVT